MNERIKELKHQASLWCDMNIPDQFGEYGYGEAWEDKFAELIVRECADAIELNTMQIPKRSISEIRTILRKHFGVEE